MVRKPSRGVLPYNIEVKKRLLLAIGDKVSPRFQGKGQTHGILYSTSSISIK
ncbi:MAG: hypothetical protein WB643_02945 [Candidatus Bathyarchaeia archaeon]